MPITSMKHGQQHHPVCDSKLRGDLHSGRARGILSRAPHTQLHHSAESFWLHPMGPKAVGLARIIGVAWKSRSSEWNRAFYNGYQIEDHASLGLRL
jgi:hypothetical protein